MRPIPSAALAVLLMVVSAGAEEANVLDILRTTDGREFELVTIHAIEPDSIRILHASGAARIEYELLPAEVQAELGGFDPELAAAHRKKREERQATRDRSMERLSILAAEKEQAEQRERERQEEVAKTRVPAELVINQLDGKGGALAKARFYAPAIEEQTKRDAFGRAITVPVRTRKWTEMTERLFWFEGIPASGLADGDSFSCWTIPDGEHVYTTTFGERSTVRKYLVVPGPETDDDE